MKRRTTFRKNINRNIMVAGGIIKEYNAYVLAYGKKKVNGVPLYAKASVGTKGAIIGAGIDGGRRKIGIDYNVTTKQANIRSHMLKKKM